MANEKPEENKKEGATKPDSETLHTTDPQEHMEGPISSIMQKAQEGFEEEDVDDTSQKEDKK